MYASGCQDSYPLRLPSVGFSPRLSRKIAVFLLDCQGERENRKKRFAQVIVAGA
jgi:hypothetical protein